MSRFLEFGYNFGNEDHLQHIIHVRWFRIQNWKSSSVAASISVFANTFVKYPEVTVEADHTVGL